MKLRTLQLKAGIPEYIGRGRVIRVLEAAEPVRIETYSLGDGDNEHSIMPANIGAEFKLFERASVTSEVDQTAVIAYSERDIYDNRLGVDGALIIESVDRAAASAVVRNYTADPAGVMVLSADVINRRTALVSTSQAVNVATAIDGEQFTVDGVLEHPASGELWVFGAGQVQVMEYLN